METQWIWRRGYSRHHGREFIFSHLLDWRIFRLHHLWFIYKFGFISMADESGRVMLKKQIRLLIKTISWPSSRRWIWKKGIKSGWWLIPYYQGFHYLTAVPTTPILQVFCWRRKLLRQFDDFVLIINYFRQLNEKKIFFCKIPGGMGENSMTSKYLRGGCFLMTFQLWI